MFNPEPTAPSRPRTLADVLTPLTHLPEGKVVGGERLVTRRERIIDEARGEGYSAGFAQGVREGNEVGRAQAFAQTEDERQALIAAQVNQFQDDMDRMGGEMRAAMSEWFLQAEQQLGRIAVIAAGRLIRRELHTDPALVVDIVRETIKEVTHAQEARIMVNPFDLKFLMGREEEIHRLAPSVKQVSIVGAADVAAGCRIESDGGAIDARVEEGLRQLVAEVIER